MQMMQDSLSLEIGGSDELHRNDTEEETDKLQRRYHAFKERRHQRLLQGLNAFREIALSDHISFLRSSSENFKAEIGGSDELHRNDTEEETDKLQKRYHGLNERLLQTLQQRLNAVREIAPSDHISFLRSSSENFKAVSKGPLLPTSFKDLLGGQPPKKSLNLKGFLLSIIRSVRNLPPQYRHTSQAMCGTILGCGANTVPALFDFISGNSTNAGNSTNTSQSLLSFGEAFAEFFPEMVNIMIYILCFFLSLMLVWSLPLGVQPFVLLFLVSAPLFHFHQLKVEASGVDVACVSFKMPLIWFKTLGALGLSLICGFLIFFTVYVHWRYIYEENQKEKENGIESSDGLAEILDE